YTDGLLGLIGGDVVAPGGEREAEITLANPDYVRDRLRAGELFDLTEGRRKVGSGTIVAIIWIQEPRRGGGGPRHGSCAGPATYRMASTASPRRAAALTPAGHVIPQDSVHCQTG